MAHATGVTSDCLMCCNMQDSSDENQCVVQQQD